MAVKGKSAPVQALRLSGQREASAVTPAVTGTLLARDDELHDFSGPHAPYSNTARGGHSYTVNPASVNQLSSKKRSGCWPTKAGCAWSRIASLTALETSSPRGSRCCALFEIEPEDDPNGPGPRSNEACAQLLRLIWSLPHSSVRCCRSPWKRAPSCAIWTHGGAGSVLRRCSASCSLRERLYRPSCWSSTTPTFAMNRRSSCSTMSCAISLLTFTSSSRRDLHRLPTR